MLSWLFVKPGDAMIRNTHIDRLHYIRQHPISGSSYLAQALWAEPWHRGERLPEKKTARESFRAQAVHSYSCTWRDGRKLSSLFLSLA
jgi:hypothetical protein